MITQPLSEFRIISKKHEYDIIKEIIQILTEKKIKVLIKPHPYESKNKYKLFKGWRCKNNQ
jgi:hypothetical protein